jgi:hypothetical protein
MIEKFFGKKVADYIMAILIITTIITLPILILSACEPVDIPNYNILEQMGVM